MNGKMVAGKPLYVAPAQKKEERKARLQAQFSQVRPVAMAPIAPRMPFYPPGVPGMGQQIMYGQAPPAFISQAGYGYPQQLVPGMRPGGAPMPNFFVPMVQQGQQGQRPGGRRGAGPMQQLPQSMPMMQQQMLPRGRVYRYPPGRNLQGIPLPGVAGGTPMQALATALANAPPEQQRTMLGEVLYPLVEKIEHGGAAKVTGMLLEMDQPEVLHLIESPEALKTKVAEAMDVLRNVSPTDQLASLSLNDNLES
jgi:polyadenylate-binding protein